MPEKLNFPPFYLLISFVSMGICSIYLPLYKIYYQQLAYIGWCISVVGFMFVLITAYQFKKAQTTIKPFIDSSTLITHGIFSFSRNPIYLGMVLMLLGTAFSLKSLSPFIICVAFVLFIRKHFILKEEEHLRAQFGEDYQKYTNKVRRWI